MGSKFTIVLDTDDPQGLRDALDMITVLNRNHRLLAGNARVKAKMGKIELVKMLREVAKLVEAGKMDSSLRDSKRFIDGKWELLVCRS